jgi:hypothetical protein
VLELHDDCAGCLVCKDLGGMFDTIEGFAQTVDSCCPQSEKRILEAAFQVDLIDHLWSTKLPLEQLLAALAWVTSAAR